MLGSLPRCLRTYYRYDKDDPIFLIIVHIRPNAALFNALHRYSESAYLTSLR